MDSMVEGSVGSELSPRELGVGSDGSETARLDPAVLLLGACSSREYSGCPFLVHDIMLQQNKWGRKPADWMRESLAN
jgi:hypothetical protein